MLRNDQPDVFKTDHEKTNVANKLRNLFVVLLFSYCQMDTFSLLKQKTN